jgi:hypothetical protein
MAAGIAPQRTSSGGLPCPHPPVSSVFAFCVAAAVAAATASMPGKRVVVLSGSPSIGGLTPPQAMAQAIDLACRRPGGATLRGALAAGR